MEQYTRTYKVERVEEVHSGDDLVLLINLGVDNLLKRVRARLYGVDTPDAHKADSSTEAGKVRDWVRSMLMGKHCHVDLHSDKKGGWIITIYTTDRDGTVCINKVLQDAGYVFNKQDK